jgi:hypothetical protein
VSTKCAIFIFGDLANGFRRKKMTMAGVWVVFVAGALAPLFTKRKEQSIAAALCVR